MAHEVIHEIHSTHDSAFVLKLDYEKAYDRVNWDFLMEMLESRGFGGKWIHWIKILLYHSSSCVRINDSNGP